MEPKDFLQSIKKYAVVIIILVMLGSLAGFYSTRYFTSGYHHTQSFFLTDPAVENLSSENIRSENYFTQEKARNFTDTAVAILDSADFKNASVKEGNSLIVRKMAPQVIRLTYVSNQPDYDFSELNKVVESFNSQIQSLTQNPNSSQLQTIAEPTAPSYSAFNPMVLALAGAMLGLILALFVVGLKNYLEI